MIGKLRLLFWIGIGMLFLPYLGIPDSWKAVLATMIGLGIIVLTVHIRKYYKMVRFKLRKYQEEEAAKDTIIHG
jgi:hypothetical protein